MASQDSADFDVAVVGGGPAGLATAIAVASTGAATALIARHLPYSDNRTTALLGASVDWLVQHGVWDRCEAEATPLRVMRLVDDTGRLIRAPETRFDCREIGLDAFGYNIANSALVAALEARASALPDLVRFDDLVRDVAPGEDNATITLEGGTSISAKLVVGADGRQSRCRDAAGIATRKHTLNQMALTFNAAHARPHQDISTEFHTPHGPCVLVPLRGNRSSVVWVTNPERAQELNALGDNDLAEAIERQSHSILGRITLEPGRSLFGLSLEQADRLANNRIALVGEAAHVVPPIGAQGLNLGLRDAAAVGIVIGHAQERHDDPGGISTLLAYENSRRADIAFRSFVIDAANRTLLSDFLPAQALRAAGLEAVKSMGPLRRAVMRAGIGTSVRS